MKLFAFLALVLGMQMLVAGGASGAAYKDCNDPRWQDHPVCQTSSSTSTSTTAPPVVPSCAEIPPIEVTKGGYFGIECEWTPAYDEAATWGSVTATVTKGSVSWLVMLVRDSNPGDICLLEEWDKPSAAELEASFPLVLGSDTYWDVGEKWCSGVASGFRDDLNGDPLNLVVNLRGKRGTVVEVSLTP